jgi:SnoaL-like domain
VQEWEARQAIQISKLFGSYFAAVDSNDAQRAGSLFAEDGALISEVMKRSCYGRSSIIAFLHELRSGWTDITIRISPPNVTFENEHEANSECYFTVYGPQGLDHWATYHDQFVRQGGTWLFKERRIVLLGASPLSRVGVGRAVN